MTAKELATQWLSDWRNDIEICDVEKLLESYGHSKRQAAVWQAHEANQ